MTYTPINWQTGDTITADKMNKMDNGWSITNELITYFNDSVVISDGGQYTQLDVTGDFSAASEIVLTLDNVEYNLTGFDDDGYWTFGAPYRDFSTYSFSLYFTDGDTSPKFTTQNSGTYALKIEAAGTVVNISNGFATAVKTAGSNSLQVVSGTTTWQEAYDALIAGKFVYLLGTVTPGSIGTFIVFRADSSDYSISFAGINSNMADSLSISHLGASSADGVLE